MFLYRNINHIAKGIRMECQTNYDAFMVFLISEEIFYSKDSIYFRIFCYFIVLCLSSYFPLFLYNYLYKHVSTPQKHYPILACYYRARRLARFFSSLGANFQRQSCCLYIPNSKAGFPTGKSLLSTTLKRRGWCVTNVRLN